MKVCRTCCCCPHRGQNALDAAVLGYQNIAALRQHIRPDERIHGIFLNLVVSLISFRAFIYGVVCPLKECQEFGALKKRVLNCLEAGAIATSCTMTHDWIEPYYADMIDNETICTLYSTNASRLVVL